ncbi:hypothetical protein [Ruminococcus gauvreauii]|uniref:Uroporphyrinogen decarboxylase (URO-D) domain-containing protein n=1 Tax=Ruminococcus gauvreauii TaxID=438033 RepID=A0ABY5VEZ5_9FIRM|nr:hypothetical protein [Ruminococcus gauvreauii]UWP58583.1 hypothetical protein NQ502_14535 [Ruminococcus gauvreauii]
MATNMTTHAAFDAPGTAVSNDTTYMFLPVEYNDEDVAVIRELAREFMDIANLPVQKETAELWERVNDLESARPVVWHNELPWHEMNVDDELTLRTSTPFAQRIEEELRRKIYLWKHMPGDMVLEPVFYSPMIIENSGMGIAITEETIASDAENNIVSHKFIPQIVTIEDTEKIKAPKVTLDKEATQATYEAYQDILGPVMPVEIKGVQGFWYAPVDDLVQLMGTNELLLNVVMEPELVHASMKKISEAYMAALDQYEALGCLGSNNLNYRMGSGAYGYSKELKRGTMTNMKCCDMWGASASQFFTSVSPEMHDEFSIAYERPWMERFGLSYYGCCERLDIKMDQLRQIKNLRKISCSPWSDTEHMAEVVGRDYVVSLKPSPACFAFDTFDEDAVRRDVQGKLKLLKNCNVEIIIKDVSTIRYDPKRLWRWVEIVSELCRNQ